MNTDKCFITSISHTYFALLYFDCFHCVVLLYCNFFILNWKRTSFYSVLHFIFSSSTTHQLSILLLRAHGLVSHPNHFAAKKYSAFCMFRVYMYIYLCVLYCPPFHVHTISNDPFVCYVILYIWMGFRATTKCMFCALYVLVQLNDVIFFWESVAMMRDILSSCSITFMCILYRVLGDTINTLYSRIEHYLNIFMCSFVFLLLLLNTVSCLRISL